MAATFPTAGKLRERVRFDRRAAQSDGMGNQAGAWSTLVSARAAQLTPQRGGEQVIANRLQGVDNFDLVVRYDSVTSAVTTDDRVVDLRNPNRVFNILWIGNLDERKRYLWMILRQGVAEG